MPHDRHKAVKDSTTDRPSWCQWLKRGLTALVALPIVGFLAVSWVVGSDVRAARDAALEVHAGDQIVALMAFVETPTHSLQERNRAIWALGQLGDSRALPFLEEHFTGGPCDHDRALCQRELGKALALCRGGTNIPALVWRHGSLRPGTPRPRDSSVAIGGAGRGAGSSAIGRL